ncbi:MAG: ParA family protein [Thermodesulfobacteriota bacterium]|nr:ParA family protein [Thermodesulfobacteriota bacterium]
MRKIVSVINHKGGVGKTTSVVSIAACLGQMGKKVLVVDIDPQGSASVSLGFHDSGGSILNAFKGAGSLPVVETKAPGVALVPSGPEFAEARHRFSGSIGSNILERCLRNTEGKWSWIIIDCPPTLEILTLNALNSSRHVIVPVEAHFLGLNGLNQIKTAVEAAGKKNKQLAIEAVVPCRAHLRRRVHREVMAELEKIFPGRVAPAVRENVSLAEAPGRGLPIILYAPKSIGAEDYKRVSRWLSKKIKKEQTVS